MVSLTVDPFTNRISTFGFSYDAGGHLVQWPGGTVTIGAEYDVEGRITRIGYDWGGGSRHYYNARNQRVRTENTLQVYGLGGELLGEYERVQGQWAPGMVRERVYFAGQLVGTVEGYGSWSMPATDRLGSLKQGSRRYPFGDGNESYANDEYATYRKDHASAHYYAWNRWYSATWGRFSSPDPYVMSGGLTNPQGWNRYSYVANDPVNFYDPRGLASDIPVFKVTAYCHGCLASTPDNSFGLGWALGFYMDLGMQTVESDMGWPGGGPLPHEEPKCFAQLKYRDVVWASEPLQRRGIRDIVPANHAFWWVQDRGGNRYIISAGPQNGDGSGYLVGGAVLGDSKDGDTASAKVAWDSGLSALNCDSVERMIEAAKNFPQDRFKYNARSGPNSNSFARYIGRVGGFHSSAPPLSFGWSYWLDIGGLRRRQN